METVAPMILEQANREDAQRLIWIQQAWTAYTGQLTKPLKVAPTGPDDNIRINYCRSVVDKSVSFLFGKEVDIDANEGTSIQSADNGSAENPTDRLLDAIWQANKQHLTLHRLAVNGSVCGMAAIKIVPGTPYPRFIVLDPATVTVALDPEDWEHILEWCIQWTAINPRTQKPVIYRQLFTLSENEAYWTMLNQQSSPDNKMWFNTSAPEVWPYPWAPIVACQNLPAPNEWWGISDLTEDIVEMQNGINMLMSDASRILRIHAHPTTWGTGFKGGDLKRNIDGVLSLPPGATLQNLEMVSDLQALDTILTRIKDAFWCTTRTPEIATGNVANIGQISGVALEILYQPLIEKTNTKRLLYGHLIEELSQHALELAGGPKNAEITIHWPDILPIDDLQTAQTSLIYEQLGVSQQTILSRLGFDPEEEKAHREEESASAGENALQQFDQYGLPTSGTPPQAGQQMMPAGGIPPVGTQPGNPNA